MRSILKSSGNMERMDKGKLTKKYSEGVGGGQRERVHLREDGMKEFKSLLSRAV